MSRRALSALVVVALLCSRTDAHAYLDPVTGSYVLQGLIGGIVAALVSLRSVRDRIFAALRSKKHDETGQAGQSHQDDPDRRA